MPARLAHWGYPLSVGLLLGLLQTGLFLQLTFLLSSAFGTYLLITLCWLLGSGIGAGFAARSRRNTRIFLLLALLAYAACALLLTASPFNTRLWPLYGALVLAAGVYPGVFFACMASVYKVRTLFLMENNGFILGLALGAVASMVAGRGALWALPLALAALIALAREPGRPTDRRSSQQE
ncbi:MAG: hypothetical protein M5R40_12735 [Anaerolineae bacterium]|nr:hypothetical protein [Anaerolineae bacterium]